MILEGSLKSNFRNMERCSSSSLGEEDSQQEEDRARDVGVRVQVENSRVIGCFLRVVALEGGKVSSRKRPMRRDWNSSGQSGVAQKWLN